MTRKIDKITIAGTRFDKRAKLTPEQRLEIFQKHHEDKVSPIELSEVYDVSRTAIRNICYPERKQQYYENAKAKKKRKKKSYTPAVKKAIYKFRERKTKLLNDGLIRERDEPKNNTPGKME